MMNYEVFEGKLTVRKPRRKEDQEFFERAKGQLGFREEIDLVTFCVAIALFKKSEDGDIELEDKVSLKEMAKMYSFGKSKFYDLLVLNFLDTKEDRLYLFERYFYAGFKILQRWFSENEPSIITNTGLERICEVCDFITEGKDNND
jgi:hypothetical protein